MSHTSDVVNFNVPLYINGLAFLSTNLADKPLPCCFSQSDHVSRKLHHGVDLFIQLLELWIIYSMSEGLNGPFKGRLFDDLSICLFDFLWLYLVL